MEGVIQADSTDLPRVQKLAAGSWILYDVANTVYSATLTFLFAGYVQLQGGLSALGLTQTLSMVLAGLSVPLFAAIADKTGHARAYLIVTTLVCIGAMVLFTLDMSLPWLMLAFGLANYCYNAALSFYNSLLPSVTPLKHSGLISGLGVGLGYLGTLTTLWALLPIQSSQGPQAAFLIAAGLFFVLAMPCFIFVRERRVMKRTRFSRALVRERFTTLRHTLKHLPEHRRVMWFLLGNFLCVDVVNTAILMFAVYSTTVFSGQMLDLFGLTIDLRPHIQYGRSGMLYPGQMAFLMLVGASLNVLALVFGISLGLLADRWRALRCMRLAVIFLMIALIGGILFTGNGFSSRDLMRINDTQGDAEQWAKLAGVMGAKSTEASADVQQAQQEEAARFTSIRKKFSAPPPVIPDIALAREPAPSWHATLYVICICGFGALGLAGIWTAGRKVLMEIAPRERLGEYFGLYGITVKLSVIGAITFTALLEHVGAVWAMLSQVGMLALGLILLFRVRMPAKQTDRSISSLPDDQGLA